MARPPRDEALLTRRTGHVEDPSIEALAQEAGHTDELAVRRQLFGWREALSILIPLVLLLVVARNVDWVTALAETHTKFVSELTASYTKAARDLLK